jgi:hypothetical protein
MEMFRESNPGLGERILNDSLEYGKVNSTSGGSAGTPGKKGRTLSSAEGIESIRTAQNCIKKALTYLSAGGPSDKENATPSKGGGVMTPSKDRPTSKSLSTPVKAKLSKGRTNECSELLCTAVHVLRCIIGQNPSAARSYESSMGNSSPLALEKICYHTLVACVDLISSLHQQNACGTPTTPQVSVSSETAAGVVKTCQVAMSTYEMLGLLVKNYVNGGDPAPEDDANIIALPSLSDETSAAHSYLTFAVPALPSESFTTGSGEFDKQLCKIVGKDRRRWRN